MSPADSLAAASLGLTLAGWLHYLWLIPQERVPARPVGHTAAHVLAVLAAGASVWLPGAGGPAWALAAAGAGSGLFFVWLLAQAALPDGEIAVSVGDPLPALSGTTDAGEPWSSDALRGRRTLFKLFRGSW